MVLSINNVYVNTYFDHSKTDFRVSIVRFPLDCHVDVTPWLYVYSVEIFLGGSNVYVKCVCQCFGH